MFKGDDEDDEDSDSEQQETEGGQVFHNILIRNLFYIWTY